MKRTCFGCKALDGAGSGLFCQLGHKIRLMPLSSRGIHYEAHPEEECEKPMTNKAWLICRRKKEQATIEAKKEPK